MKELNEFVIVLLGNLAPQFSGFVKLGRARKHDQS